MANFARFATFSTKVAQNDSEWPISPNLQLSESFPTEVAQNDSEFSQFTTFPIFCHQSGSE